MAIGIKSEEIQEYEVLHVNDWPSIDKRSNFKQQ